MGERRRGLDSTRVEPPMSYRETEHLRVLIANERKDRLALVAPIVVGLGHEVIAREIDVADVGAVTARERPDVALVGLGESSAHALELIDKIVREAACPVIVLLHARDPEFVKEASKRGVFAHISDADVEDWQSSIDIVLRRFAEYHDAPRRVRAPRADRARQGHPDGAPRHRRGERLRDAARAVAHRQPQARSTSPPPSSTATACSRATRNPRRPSRADGSAPAGGHRPTAGAARTAGRGPGRRSGRLARRAGRLARRAG